MPLHNKPLKLCDLRHSRNSKDDTTLKLIKSYLTNSSKNEYGIQIPVSGSGSGSALKKMLDPEP